MSFAEVVTWTWYPVEAANRLDDVCVSVSWVFVLFQAVPSPERHAPTVVHTVTAPVVAPVSIASLNVTPTLWLRAMLEPPGVGVMLDTVGGVLSGPVLVWNSHVTFLTTVPWVLA